MLALKLDWTLERPSDERWANFPNLGLCNLHKKKFKAHGKKNVWGPFLPTGLYNEGKTLAGDVHSRW